MEGSGGGKIFSKVFRFGMRRWPERTGVEICSVTERIERPIFWYTETGKGRNCHMLTEQEYVEIGGKQYTVADGADKISSALEREKIEKMLERM